MVQRKVPNKLGIHSDHVKSQKWLGNLKPTSCQHQDGRNRGPDMKKKMKRSRSIKLSDIESLKSSTALKKPVSQPGKPPPLRPPTTAQTPQKQLIIKKTDGSPSPNYMKSTTSSEARKERSQVSPLNTQTGSTRKNLHRRNSSNSKLSPASINKPARTLSRTSSLKLVRAPSFKPVRGSAKRCSRVAICADASTQKATCSSTLKDSKFPAYLILNPGGTEAEGTSVMKVCPYTHCSLNGHHHKPVPPLKCFLKARRHSLKVQKSMKLEVLSPRRARPSGDGTEEIHGGLLNFSDDKPMVQEIGMDFFIQIYAKNTEDGADASRKSTQDVSKTVGAVYGEGEGQVIESCFREVQEAAADQDSNKQGSEILSNESPESEIDFEEDPNNTNSQEMDVTGSFVAVDEYNGDSDSSSNLYEGEAILGSYDGRSDIEGESHGIVEDDGNISEAIDLEWEEGQLSTSDFDTEADYLNEQDDDELCSKAEQNYLNEQDEDKLSSIAEKTPEIRKLDWHKKPKVIRSEAAFSNCTEEILADEVLQELFAEETASIDMQCIDSDYNSESDGISHSWEILQSIHGKLANHQLSSAEYAFVVPNTEEENDKGANRDLFNAVTTSVSAWEPVGKSIGARERIKEDGVHQTENDTDETNPQLGDAENDCTMDISAEDLNNQQEHKCFQADMVETNDKDNIDEHINVAEINQDFSIAELPGGEAGEATEAQEHIANAELTFEVHVSDSPQNFSAADGDDAELNVNRKHVPKEACQLNVTTEFINSSQDLVNEDTEPQDPQLDGQDERNDVVGIQNLFDRDQDEANKMKVLTSVDFEGLGNSRMHKINSSGDSTGEFEKMEVKANNENSMGSLRTLLPTRTNPDEEEDETYRKIKWTIRGKKLNSDLLEEGEFNPREPNFLSIVPDPEAEKVDLRHQMMDDRKNSEEWMLDYALRQVVTKLAPARKRKVALLVEAFEKVLPTPKYETHVRHTSAAFSHTRPIQACS